MAPSTEARKVAGGTSRADAWSAAAADSAASSSAATSESEVAASSSAVGVFRGRAHAEIERAAWQYVEVRRQVTLQVREASLLRDHAAQALGILRSRVLPLVEQEIRRAEKIYGDGQVSYLVVLEATRQRADAGLREAELMANIRRAQARLDHGVGGKSLVTH